MTRILKAFGITMGAFSCLAGIVWFGYAFPVAFLVIVGAVMFAALFLVVYEELC